ncbi:hypothetical protein J3R82DRAFT_8526 [Butyriboletus roseoflavus]|nr:hypothetical protein J3R82DRAFT_8526 [Butyriboletus roseoflavus]
MPSFQDHSILQIPCGHPGCLQFFKTERGRKTHLCSAHPVLTPFPAPWIPSPPTVRTPTPPIPHFPGPAISDPLAETQPCDEHGEFLKNGAPPPVQVNNPQSWFPYDSQLQFETAEFLYTKCQISAPKIDALLDLWTSSLYPYGAWPPFVNHHQLYRTIDSMKLGDSIKWQCLSASYMGNVPAIDPPEWMSQKYDI